MRCIVYDITIVRPYEYDKREFSNNSTHTVGAWGFSCAVSGFGQVLKSNSRETSEHVSVCGRRNEVLRSHAKKSSGT